MSIPIATTNSFNPLPSPKQGETFQILLPAISPTRFQSAPLTEARGDLGTATAIATGTLVSIRSPHRSKGRHLLYCRYSWLARVSIRSPHRSKGRRSSVARRYRLRQCFNPLPSPKQGETALRALRATREIRFQSAPLTEARGDPGSRLDPLPATEFQSAPLTEARGDHNRVDPRRRLVLVSIRSPHRSKGRRLYASDSAFLPVFQSAPLTEARGDRPFVWTDTEGIGFQSAPLTEARGDLGTATGTTGITLVSIRSPHRSKGRPPIGLTE